MEMRERQPVRRRTTRRIGRLRLPIAGPYRPWATLYRLPDGRLLWTVRLWDDGRPVRHAYPTRVIRAFARANGLRALAEEVERLVDRAREDGLRSGTEDAPTPADRLREERRVRA
jgi:hypothetical protein